MKYQNNQHFSHRHVLNKFNLDEDKLLTCNACEEDITTEPLHGCHSCSYFLHDNCLKAPRYLEHPSHPSHPLTLLQVPTYSDQSFTCNACGSGGSCFSYCCAHCEFDLHLKCGTLPTTLLLDDHHHVLKLFFRSPYDDSSSEFACSICDGLKENSLWSYYCEECDYGTHLECAKSTDEAVASESKSNCAGDTEGSGRRPAGNGTKSRISLEIEAIKAADNEHDELYAAMIEAKINQKCRKNALELWSSRRKRDSDSDSD